MVIDDGERLVEPDVRIGVVRVHERDEVGGSGKVRHVPHLLHLDIEQLYERAVLAMRELGQYAIVVLATPTRCAMSLGERGSDAVGSDTPERDQRRFPGARSASRRTRELSGRRSPATVTGERVRSWVVAQRRAFGTQVKLIAHLDGTVNAQTW